jgi:hypothetical protein
MSRIDLHVDGLMDRARQGSLDAPDCRRLLAHCERCDACSIELRWIEDGLHARDPSAGDRALGTAIVDALLGSGDPSGAPSRDPRPRPRRRRALHTAVLAFAGMLAASAAAALYTGVQHWRERDAIETPRRDASPEHEPPRKPRAARKPHRPPSTSTSSPPTLPPALTPTPTPTPAPTPQPRSPGTARRPPSPARSTPAPVPGHALAAESLFARANAERARGLYEVADGRYAELARDYRGTRSELAARISHGNLLLHRLDRPAHALQAFASYLAARPDGPLAEEARVGMAVSLQRLGRAREEREAWRSLLERHPGSLHGARARARLSQLAH